MLIATFIDHSHASTVLESELCLPSYPIYHVCMRYIGLEPLLATESHLIHYFRCSPYRFLTQALYIINLKQNLWVKSVFPYNLICLRPTSLRLYPITLGWRFIPGGLTLTLSITNYPPGSQNIYIFTKQPKYIFISLSTSSRPPESGLLASLTIPLLMELHPDLSPFLLNYYTPSLPIFIDQLLFYPWSSLLQLASAKISLLLFLTAFTQTPFLQKIS